MTGATQLKDVFLPQMGGEWQRFLDTAQGIPEDHLSTPGAVGHWSVRDAIIHVYA